MEWWGGWVRVVSGEWRRVGEPCVSESPPLSHRTTHSQLLLSTPAPSTLLQFYNTINTKHSAWLLPRTAKTRALFMTVLLASIYNRSIPRLHISPNVNATARWPRITELSGATGPEDRVSVFHRIRSFGGDAWSIMDRS